MDDCFDKILKIRSDSELVKYKVIVKLMKDLENGILDTLRVRNCLLFLLNLYFEREYSDYTDRIGKNSQDLLNGERLQMQEILRWELNN